MSVSLKAFLTRELDVTKDLMAALYQETRADPKPLIIATIALMLADHVLEESHRRKETAWDPFLKGVVVGGATAAVANVVRRCVKRFHSMRKLH